MSLPAGLSRKEGWRRYVDGPPRLQPEQLSLDRLRALDDAARDEYNQSRHAWHPNLAVVKTPQLTAVLDRLDLIVGSNRHDGDRIRGVAAIDALPGMGKSTIAKTFGRAFDRADIQRNGTLTSDGQTRIPVFHVELTAGTTVKTLNERICLFYGHPSATRGRGGFSADRLASFALDSVLAAETKLGIIDDIHRIDPQRKDGLDVTNHLKYLNSEFPITFLYVGVDLEGKKFFSEGGSGSAAAYAQTGRRWTRLEVPKFEINTDEEREVWQSLLKAAERQIVLTGAPLPHWGTLASCEQMTTREFGGIKPVAGLPGRSPVCVTPAADVAGAPEVPPFTALMSVTPQRGPVPVTRARRLPGTRSPSTGPCAASAGQ